MPLRAIKNVMQSAAGRLGYELRSPLRRRPAPTGPRLSEEGIAEEYLQPYPLSRYYPLWTVIADRIGRDRLERVLEVGCGNGRLAALLLEQGVERYVGFDFSPVYVRMARAVAPGGRFEVADATTTSLYTDVEHDIIVCTEVLEHIADDLLVVSRFPAGSRCLCTVPNFPDDGHVRHFQTSEQVARRYGPLFRDLDVVAFKGATGSGVGTYFVFDGVRNDAKSSAIPIRKA